MDIRASIQKQFGNTAGLIIVKDGKRIIEESFNGFTLSDPIYIASVAKSITSTIIGIAVDKGLLNIDQNVLEFFPDYRIKRGEKTIQNITIEHLLTMTAPYKGKSEPYSKVLSSMDWTNISLDLLGGKGIIGEFRYSTICLQILSGVIQNASGMDLRDFSGQYLFSPLGIKKPENRELRSREDYMNFVKGRELGGWITDPEGVNTPGWGLYLSTEDLLKIGLLYLNDGMWNYKRVISSAWIEKSTSVKSYWGGKPYGYLWWIIEEGISFAAIGDGGNLIYIDKQQKAVAAMTATFMPKANNRIEQIKSFIDYF